jgi:hypothetical protein
MKLNTNISCGNRPFIQVYPTSAFLNTYDYTSCMNDIVHNGPGLFNLGILDWCKWNIHNLQALLRNFIQMDMSEVI